MSEEARAGVRLASPSPREHQRGEPALGPWVRVPAPLPADTPLSRRKAPVWGLSPGSSLRARALFPSPGRSWAWAGSREPVPGTPGEPSRGCVSRVTARGHGRALRRDGQPWTAGTRPARERRAPRPRSSGGDRCSKGHVHAWRGVGRALTTWPRVAGTPGAPGRSRVGTAAAPGLSEAQFFLRIHRAAVSLTSELSAISRRARRDWRTGDPG